MRRRFPACGSPVLSPSRAVREWRGNAAGRKSRGLAALGGICGRLLHYLDRFRDRLIGRTSAFGAEYRGSSPRPGTRFLRTNSLPDRKSTRLNSSHTVISYAVFCLKKKKNTTL